MAGIARVNDLRLSDCCMILFTGQWVSFLNPLFFAAAKLRSFAGIMYWWASRCDR